MAATRRLRELEIYLAQHGVELADNALELELNSFGWRVVGEKRARQAIELEIECAVECDESLPRTLRVASDDGRPDRDVALMRALELVLDYGFLRDGASA